MSETKALLFIVAIIALGFFFGFYQPIRDASIEKAAQAYELCIYQQYHMTPAEYVGEFGKYPTCD